MKIFFIAMTFFLCLQHTVMAKAWFVATNGSDANPGTETRPFKTLPTAITAANAGDTINLRGGQYTSQEIRIDKSRLTIRSYPGEWAVITAPTNIEDIASCIWYNDPEVSGGSLERLEIVGGYYYGVSFETNWDWGLPQRRGVSNIVLRECMVHHTGRDCIKIKPACDNIQILHCELFASGKGISNLPENGGPNAEAIDNVNGDGMIVRNCHIHHISTTGVYVKGGAQNALVEENLIYETGEAGILLGFYTDAEFFDQDGTNPKYFECRNSVARNNIVHTTGGAGIGFFAADNCAAYHNTVVTASSVFHAPLYFSPGDIWISDRLSLTPPNVNIQVYNNIFVDQSGSGEEDFTVQIRAGGLSGNNLINHNIYFKPVGAAQFDDGVSWPSLSFQQWKAQMGFDAASQTLNPGLKEDFHLAAGSPAIDAGRESPATRDYDLGPRSGLRDVGADEINNASPLEVPPPGGVIGTFSGSMISAVPVLTSIDAGFSVFPNPASSEINVSGNGPIIKGLYLFNSLGQEVRTSSGTTMRVSDLPPGLYQLVIRTAENYAVSRVILATGDQE